jgi:hypothetical protein
MLGRRMATSTGGVLWILLVQWLTTYGASNCPAHSFSCQHSTVPLFTSHYEERAMLLRRIVSGRAAHSDIAKTRDTLMPKEIATPPPAARQGDFVYLMFACHNAAQMSEECYTWVLQMCAASNAARPGRSQRSQTQLPNQRRKGDRTATVAPADCPTSGTPCPCHPGPAHSPYCSRIHRWTCGLPGAATRVAPPTALTQ